MQPYESISNFGIMVVISGFAIWGGYQIVSKISPRLDEIKLMLQRKYQDERALQEISDKSTKAMEEVAKSNDNLAHGLSLLNKTMEGYMELLKIVMEENKETQQRLYTHDDRAERIFTMTKEIWLANKLENKATQIVKEVEVKEKTNGNGGSKNNG